MSLDGGNLKYFLDYTADTAFRERFNVPRAGSRSYDDASLTDYGIYGYYWSSSPYGSTPYYTFHLNLNSSNVYTNFADNRANGYSVRCFKNSYEPTKTVTFNLNG